MRWFAKLFRRKPPVDLRAVWDNLRPKVIHLARPAIRLKKTPTATLSWFGGTPIVDSDKFQWPESSGKPIAFLGQLDLAELSAAYRVEWLPDRGSLAFFYDVESTPGGFDPRDKGKWEVLYFSEASVEARMPPALRKSSVFTRAYLRASKVDALPDADSEPLNQLDLSEEEWDAYCDFSSGEDYDTPLHQIDGFPSPVQANTMELECQLAANGVYVGTAKGYKSAAAKKLAPGARDWRLLLQFDSDDEVGAIWHDLGKLYFWIREQDVRAMRFDEAWVILQST